MAKYLAYSNDYTTDIPVFSPTGSNITVVVHEDVLLLQSKTPTTPTINLHYGFVRVGETSITVKRLHQIDDYCVDEGIVVLVEHKDEAGKVHNFVCISKKKDLDIEDKKLLRKFLDSYKCNDWARELVEKHL